MLRDGGTRSTAQGGSAGVLQKVTARGGMRIIDWLRLRSDQEPPVFSFEYFPVKDTGNGRNIEQLYEKIQRQADASPAWINVTWGPLGSTKDVTMRICGDAVQFLGLDVMMHLTCLGMTTEEARVTLQQVKEKGVRNLLITRGDSEDGRVGDFPHAIDLVRFVKEEHADHFCIAVAGFPGGHPDAAGEKDTELLLLKAKVDAGADLIITEIIHDAEVYREFVQDCRAVGVECDIFPAVMPWTTFKEVKRLRESGRMLPPEMIKDIEEMGGDAARMQDYGTEFCVNLCRALFSTGAPGVHIYTMNKLDPPLRVVEALELSPSRLPRACPLRSSHSRGEDDVRPIFWKHRESSYISRTAQWDEFPSSRFQSRAGQYAEFASDFVKTSRVAADQRALWKFVDERGLQQVFIDHLYGKVPRLPWSPESPSDEQFCLRRRLQHLCECGLFPVNSQMRANGVPSSDPIVGWDVDNGIVYQRAYVEFFCSSKTLELLTREINAFCQVSSGGGANGSAQLAFMAVNAHGQVHANVPNGTVTAVTWGVFPNAEIRQPTVVDIESFLAWKDEAFALWDEWAEVFDAGSPQRQIISSIQSSWFLMNVVDNDFISSDLFAHLARFLAST
jgi:methylenetetrahydrofolate reductase (NADPH)